MRRPARPLHLRGLQAAHPAAGQLGPVLPRPKAALPRQRLRAAPCSWCSSSCSSVSYWLFYGVRILDAPRAQLPGRGAVCRVAAGGRPALCALPGRGPAGAAPAPALVALKICAPPAWSSRFYNVGHLRCKRVGTGSPAWGGGGGGCRAQGGGWPMAGPEVVLSEDWVGSSVLCTFKVFNSVCCRGSLGQIGWELGAGSE